MQRWWHGKSPSRAMIPATRTSLRTRFARERLGLAMAALVFAAALADTSTRTLDGAVCALPFHYEPQNLFPLAIANESSFSDCTRVDSSTPEPWCSTSAVYGGSWGACLPSRLLVDESQDHFLALTGSEGQGYTTATPWRMGPAFTLEAWVRPHGRNKANTAFQWILSTHNRVRIGLHGTRNALVFTAHGLWTHAADEDPRVLGEACDGSPHAPGCPEVLTTDAELEHNAWTHVAMVATGTSISVYSNGRVVSRIGAAGVASTGNGLGNLTVGGDPLYPQTAFRGGVDEVRLWTVARDQRAVVGSLLQPLTSFDVEAGLRAYWPITHSDENSTDGSLRDATEVPPLWADAVLQPTRLVPHITASAVADAARHGRPFAGHYAAGFITAWHGGPTHLQDSGGSPVDRVPLQRAAAGTELVFDGKAGTHALAPGLSSALPLRAVGTIEAWVKPAATNAQGAEAMTLLAREGSFAVGFISEPTPAGEPGRAVRLGVALAGRHAPDTSQLVDLRCVIDAGHGAPWVHVAVTFDKKAVRGYVDGVLSCEDTTLGGGDIRKSSAPLEMGGRLESIDEAYAGAVDELRIWRVARTQEQIQELLYHRVGPRAGAKVSVTAKDARLAGLLAAYSLDEGRGRIVRAAGPEGPAGPEHDVLVMGDAFHWRLATSPAALVAALDRDARPDRFELAFASAAAMEGAVAGLLLEPADAVTVELWFRWHGPNQARTPMQVIAQHTKAFVIALIGTDVDADDGAAATLAVARARSAVLGFGEPLTLDDTAFAPGVWYHVAVAWAKGDGRPSIFVNGAGEGSVAPMGQGVNIGSSVLDGPSRCYLGTNDDPQRPTPFCGAMADVRVWREARTAEEVHALYLERLVIEHLDDTHELSARGGEGGFAAHARRLGPRMVAYYSLDEGLGRTSLDRSGQGAPLMLGAGVRWRRSTAPIAPGPDGRVFSGGYALALGGGGAQCAGAGGAGLSTNSHVAIDGVVKHVASKGTIELWVKLVRHTQVGEEAPRALVSIPGEQGLTLLAERDGSLHLLDERVARGQSPPPLQSGGPRLPFGRWTHVALAYSGKQATVYINGLVAVDRRLAEVRPRCLAPSTQAAGGPPCMTPLGGAPRCLRRRPSACPRARSSSLAPAARAACTISTSVVPWTRCASGGDSGAWLPSGQRCWPRRSSPRGRGGAKACPTPMIVCPASSRARCVAAWTEERPWPSAAASFPRDARPPRSETSCVPSPWTRARAPP